MNSFTSYAQNFEDVLLWRALGHIKHGFYIDVGANDPETHSVTKAFYERGWHGINIEPLPHFAPRFAEQRVHDINLQMAAGAVDGETTLYDVPDVDGWASSDRDVAQQHQQDGFRIVELTVPVKRLTTICEQYVKDEIHFLKIDVEGFETEVLQGMDFARWQPWIVVVEATLPNTQVTNHEKWEALLLDHGYQFVYFDGLNRYYVSPHQLQLAASLQVQPNVFDNFHSCHLAKAQATIEMLSVKADQTDSALTLSHKLLGRVYVLEERERQTVRESNDLEHRLNAANVALANMERQLHERAALVETLDARLNALYRSISWQLTRPVRLLCRLIGIQDPGAAPSSTAAGGAARQAPAVEQALAQFPEAARRVMADLQTANSASPAPTSTPAQIKPTGE